MIEFETLNLVLFGRVFEFKDYLVVRMMMIVEQELVVRLFE